MSWYDEEDEACPDCDGTGGNCIDGECWTCNGSGSLNPYPAEYEIEAHDAEMAEVIVCPSCDGTALKGDDGRCETCQGKGEITIEQYMWEQELENATD